MISRADFTLTHEPGTFPDTEDIHMRLTISGGKTIDLQQQERGSLDLRKMAEDELLSRGMRHIYGDIELEIEELRRTVRASCGAGASLGAIDAAFGQVFGLLQGKQ